MSEPDMNICPSCGALPCDWVNSPVAQPDNPHIVQSCPYCREVVRQSSDCEWRDLDEALDTLHSGQYGQEFRTHPAVYTNALKTISSIRSIFPAPKIWAHGPDSVVLEWGTFRLTISADNIHGHYLPRSLITKDKEGGG